MANPSLLTYCLLAMVLTVTPGPDTLLVVRGTLARGLRGGIETTAGILTGGAFHACLAAAGLSAFVASSAVAYDLAKLAGAVYLCFLGVKSLLTRQYSDNEVEAASLAKPRQAYLEGLITNALNPKVALFYLAFLPQFVNKGDNVAAKTLLLVGIHYAMSGVWLSLVAALVVQSARLIPLNRFQVWGEKLSGVVFLGLGARLALERR